jgi:hypothetical protein
MGDSTPREKAAPHVTPGELAARAERDLEPPQQFPYSSEVHELDALLAEYLADDPVREPDTIRLLVVEEDHELRELLREVLEAAGHRVVAVPDARALSIGAGSFDAAVTRAPMVEAALRAAAPGLPLVTFHPSPLHGLLLLAAVRRAVRQ